MRKFNKAYFIIGIVVLLITILFPVLVSAKDTKPDLIWHQLAQETGGYWQLVEIIEDPMPESWKLKQVFNEGQLWSSSTHSLSEGRFFSKVEWFGDSYDEKYSIFAAEATWSRPPEQIYPDTALLLDADVSITVNEPSKRETFLLMTVSTFSPDVTCASEFYEEKRVCFLSVSTFDPEDKEECVLQVGSGSSPGDQFALGYCVDYVCGYRYVYEWVSAEEKPAEPAPGAVDPETEVEISHEYIKTTYGIDIWDSFGDDGYARAVWSSQELTWLNDVLKELPPELRDRMAVNRIVRNTIDIDEDGNPMPSTFGVYEPCDISVDPHCDGSSATIRIFDHAKTPSDFLNDPDGEKQFKATILHEMVHGMQNYKDRHSIYVNDFSPLIENYIDATRQITDMDDPGFNGWNGWNWDGQRWRYTNDSSNQPPTSYGLTDPDEDMAESVMMYVYDPERLKNSSYERYYFIRDEMFGGVEYEDGVQKKP